MASKTISQQPTTTRSYNDDADIKVFSAEQSSAPPIRMMHCYAELTKLPFMCVDVDQRTVVAQSRHDFLPILPDKICNQLTDISDVQLFELPSGLLFYSLHLPQLQNTRVAALGYVLTHPDARPTEIVVQAAELGWPQTKLDDWLAKQTVCDPQILERLLLMARDQTSQVTLEENLRDEIVTLSDQIDHTYEEISLLHNLAQHLQISRSPGEVAELCLQRLHGLINSAGNVIWLDDMKKGTPYFLIEGELPFEEMGLARLVARFEEYDWSRPLVKNQIRGTLLGADFPDLENMVIVPIAQGAHRSGWILSCNKSGGQEFGTVEASLLNSVATILGTHVRNIDLYRQHDELLLSFVRSLVSTLDAKDRYTRGHSERVALIARRLGEKINLPEEDLYDIYLAGLLHDIGKIGVDDRILRKPGQLTDEEFKQIQKHPVIGHQILAGLKNLQKVIPGVRNHHENYNGKGYPDGLKGEEIPLMARILAVADAYDAMGSDRPYRQGMPLDKLEDIFQRGAGQQWDARIIQAYFDLKEEIKQICENYSPSNGDLLGNSLTNRQFY